MSAQRPSETGRCFGACIIEHEPFEKLPANEGVDVGRFRSAGHEGIGVDIERRPVRDPEPTIDLFDGRRGDRPTDLEERPADRAQR